MKRAIAAGCGAVLALSPLVSTVRAEASPASNPSSIHWTRCSDADLQGLQCAAMTVPLDHSRPYGQKISIALDRSRHTGPASGYQGVLLVNPGGPGGGGRGFAADVAAGLPNNLRRAYDVVGFDPRGVGASRPALSCVPDYFKPVRPDYVVHNDGQLKTWLSRSKAYAQACGHKYGPLLDHMRTTDVTADMDDLRRALGQKKINYFGASYGTYLGAVYATQHPDRVRRMVLDSNVRPGGVWYQDNLDQDYAFDNSVKSFFGWIAGHSASYGLGTTPTEVEDAYYAMRAKLADHPAGGVVGPDELDDTIQVGAYLATIWPSLAEAWSDYAVHNNPGYLVDRFHAWGEAKEGEFAVYNAVQCTDAPWPKGLDTWLNDTVAIHEKAPFQAWGNMWFNAPCLYWPARSGTPVTIKGSPKLPPVLMFQATLDAATPYSGGLDMHQAIAGSRLVIEDGGRTHAVVQRGNACIDSKFNAYLATGKVPADMSHCAKLPDPEPASGGRPHSTDTAPATGPAGRKRLRIALSVIR